MLSKLKLRIFGIKPKSSGEDMIPRGINRSLVPQDFLDECKHWDREMFDNQIILPRTDKAQSK